MKLAFSIALCGYLGCTRDLPQTLQVAHQIPSKPVQCLLLSAAHMNEWPPWHRYGVYVDGKSLLAVSIQEAMGRLVLKEPGFYISWLCFFKFYLTSTCQMPNVACGDAITHHHPQNQKTIGPFSKQVGDSKFIRAASEPVRTLEESTDSGVSTYSTPPPEKKRT